MQIYTLRGIEEINEYLSLSMQATLSALVDAGKLSAQDATEFRDTHVVQIVTESKMWSWIRKTLKIEPSYNNISVLKIIN